MQWLPLERYNRYIYRPLLTNTRAYCIFASPIAMALIALAPHLDWSLSLVVQVEVLEKRPLTKRYSFFIATQEQDDLPALSASTNATDGFVAFVGSQKNIRLWHKLVQRGVPEQRVRAVQALAGLDIGAVTVEKIALSILTELMRPRRKAFQGEPRND